MGNISAAARSLFLAQSAVSTQMSILSRAAGAPLLERVAGRWRLTASGRIFYKRAQELLAIVGRLEHELADVTGSVAGRLILASTRTISDTILASIVAGFTADHPDIRLDVVTGNRHDAEMRLAADEVDAALVALPIGGRALRIMAFDEDRLVLVVPHGHRLSGQPATSFENLGAERFVVFERGSGVRAVLEERLGERFAALDVRLELSSSDALVRSVEAGIGITFLPERVAQRWAQVAPIATVRLSDVDLVRKLALVIPESRSHSTVLATFESWLRAAHPVGPEPTRDAIAGGITATALGGIENGDRLGLG